MWLARSDAHTHGTDSNLRLVMNSLENVREFPYDKNTPGPPLPCSGLAIEWIGIEGPLHDAWPPASQRALFGDLSVQLWTKESGEPQPVQQKWPRGMHGSYPEDIYGENGTKRVAVHVVSAEPDKDSRRLLTAAIASPFFRDGEFVVSSGSSGNSGGETTGEGGAFADIAFDRDGAAVCLDEGFDDG